MKLEVISLSQCCNLSDPVYFSYSDQLFVCSFIDISLLIYHYRIIMIATHTSNLKLGAYRNTTT